MHRVSTIDEQDFSGLRHTPHISIPLPLDDGVEGGFVTHCLDNAGIIMSKIVALVIVVAVVFVVVAIVTAIGGALA